MSLENSSKFREDFPPVTAYAPGDMGRRSRERTVRAWAMVGLVSYNAPAPTGMLTKPTSVSAPVPYLTPVT